LDQDFSAEKSIHRYVASHIFLLQSKRYNCSIIDFYEWRIVMSVSKRRIDAKFVTETLVRALKSCGGEAELINLWTFKSEERLFAEIATYALVWHNNQGAHAYNGEIPPAKVG
jgi:hypothetical protein